MDSISNNFSSSISLQSQQNKSDGRFASVDKDGSNSISKAEFTERLSESPMAGTFDPAKANKMFEMADTNGDGEVSAAEKDIMKQKMQERMGGLMERMAEGGNVGESLNDFLESLLENTDDEESLEEILAMKKRMEEQGFNEETSKEFQSVINNIIPKIDVHA